MGDNGDASANANAGGDGNAEYIKLKVVGQVNSRGALCKEGAAISHHSFLSSLPFDM